MPRPGRRTLLSLMLLALPLGAPAVHAQDPIRPALPSEVAAAVIDFWNDPRRERFQGATAVQPGEVLESDIGVLGGPLDLHGRVEGSILVVNGDAVLHRGAVVTGDLLVLGGTIAGLDSAEVRGEILRYPGRLAYRMEGERMLPASLPSGSVTTEPVAGPPAQVESGRPQSESSLSAGGAASTAPDSDLETDFLITTGNSYNRVEGLPITFGPRLRTRGPNPLQVHALAIFRTESGFTLNPARFGYYVRAERELGGRGEWRLGATLHSVVDPIEDWHLTDLENALATFLFHEDFRDHYEREGISAFATVEPRALPLAVTGEVRWERHRSLPAGSPLTLFDNEAPWRAQPLVGEGRVGSVRLQASYDTRSDPVDPSVGWYLRGFLEQGFHAELERPAAFTGGPGPASEPVAAEPFGRFSTGFADLRRYNRLSPDVRFNVRGLVGGSLTGSPLPPQRQHAYGGEGSLPGFSFFSQDCGARASLLRLSSDPRVPDPTAFPYYGCDGFVLVQAELRGKLDFRFRFDSAPWEDDEEVGFGWDIVPDWVFFVDGGTGWSFDGRQDEPFRIDAGAGLIVDRLGIFVALPLDGAERANVFVRIGPRF